MASTIKIKRSSVAGKVPTTSDIASGELALNTKDQKLYSSNGTVVFPIGSKLTNITVSGNTSVYGLLANGSLGTSGYILKTNGTNAYWDVAPTGGGGGSGLISYTSKTLDAIKGSDTVLTNVTAVNASAYLLVANAVSTYATKSNPTTSGLLAHTGRATISTNLAVSGNTSLSGLVNLNYVGSANATLAIRGTNTKGGAGYHDFLMARNGGGGGAPAKWFRINNIGTLEILNDAYSAVLLAISDTGSVTYPLRHGFRVYGSGTTNNLTTTQNGDGKLTNSNFAVDYNQGGTLHANTGVFTARSGGLYQICLNVRNAGYSSGISQAIVWKNKGVAGEAVMVMIEYGSSSSMNHVGGSTVASLAVGDTLSLRVAAGQITFDGNDNWSVTHIG